MQRLTVVGVSLLIVLCAGAVAAAGALAAQSEPYFKVVSGAGLPLNVEIESGKLKLFIPAAGLEIECESMTGTAKINDEVSGGQKIGILEGGQLKKKGCIVVGAPQCRINEATTPGEIVDTGVHAKGGYTPGTANSSNVRFHATSTNTGGVFTVVEISGSECALAESYAIKKGVIGSIPKADIGVSLVSFNYVLHVNSRTLLQELTEIENPAIGSGVIKDELGFGTRPAGLEFSSTPSEPIVKLTAAEVSAGDKVSISLS
ncbi:MAG TPA: hypothetical protein VMS02_06485 [Solirubrobacteraceae bacterium]|nr:hypothetical protein [Solirubrobacteraceae bacterium]